MMPGICQPHFLQNACSVRQNRDLPGSGADVL